VIKKRKMIRKPNTAALPETVVMDAKEHYTLLINLGEVKSNTEAIRKARNP
jgi:hypothetical protein